MDLIFIANSTVKIILLVGMPALLVSMIVGLLVSIFQAVTQVSDAALAFVPKMILVSAFIIFTLPWVGEQLDTFAKELWGIILVFGQ